MPSQKLVSPSLPPSLSLSHTAIPSEAISQPFSPLPRIYSALNQMFFWISFFELVTLPAIFETMNGSGRAPGDFMFDPLGLGKGNGRARMELAEIKNGRLAMIAIG